MSDYNKRLLELPYNFTPGNSTTWHVDLVFPPDTEQSKIKSFHVIMKGIDRDWPYVGDPTHEMMCVVCNLCGGRVWTRAVIRDEDEVKVLINAVAEQCGITADLKLQSHKECYDWNESMFAAGLLRDGEMPKGIYEISMNPPGGLWGRGNIR